MRNVRNVKNKDLTPILRLSPLINILTATELIDIWG